MEKLIRIIVDPTTAGRGQYVIGGVRLVRPRNDQELGKELRTTEVRVHSESEARALSSLVRRTDGMRITA